MSTDASSAEVNPILPTNDDSCYVRQRQDSSTVRSAVRSDSVRSDVSLVMNMAGLGLEHTQPACGRAPEDENGTGVESPINAPTVREHAVCHACVLLCLSSCFCVKTDDMFFIVRKGCTGDDVRTLIFSVRFDRVMLAFVAGSKSMYSCCFSVCLQAANTDIVMATASSPCLPA